MKRKIRTPETRHKTVLFGAASETKWAENRNEYVPEGEFVTKFALCMPIPEGQGAGYVIDRIMAGIEVDESEEVCSQACQWYHAVPHQEAKCTGVIICDAIKGRTSLKLQADDEELPQCPSFRQLRRAASLLPNVPSPPAVVGVRVLF